jgi:hydrogenase maturation protease
VSGLCDWYGDWGTGGLGDSGTTDRLVASDLRPATVVLGLGNVLMGDDGLGPAVARAFEAEYVVPPDVEVVDLGTPGLDLLPWLADVDRVILVDTVKSDHPAGTVLVYDKTDIMRHAPMQRTGPHDPGVKDALFALEFAGRAPREVVLIGVVPATTAMGLELSPPAQAAVTGAVAHVVHALRQSGSTILRREHTEVSPPCWPHSPTGMLPLSGSG